MTKDLYYTIEDFNVADLLCKNTIDGYINLGEFYCKSVDQNKNIKFSISQKSMKLAIDKYLFYSLGGIHLGKFKKNVKNDIYYFDIDLSYNHMDKLRSELRSELIDKIEIKFIWHPSSIDTCQSSIAKYFSQMGYTVNGQKNLHTTKTLFGVKLPKLPETSHSDDNEEMSNFIELIGMNLLECDYEDNQCSSYDISQDKIIEVGRGKLIALKGLMSQVQLRNLISKCQEILKESLYPYLAITIIPYHTIIITPDKFYLFL